MELALRPERIAFSTDGSGLRGTVVERVFLGSQWLLKVESDLGVLLVSRRNGGQQEAAPGDTVHLVWNSADLKLLAIEDRAART